MCLGFFWEFCVAGDVAMILIAFCEYRRERMTFGS